MIVDHADTWLGPGPEDLTVQTGCEIGDVRHIPDGLVAYADGLPGRNLYRLRDIDTAVTSIRIARYVRHHEYAAALHAPEQRDTERRVISQALRLHLNRYDVAALALTSPNVLVPHLAMACADYRTATWKRGARRALATGADPALVADRLSLLLTVLPIAAWTFEYEYWLRLPSERARDYFLAGMTLREAQRDVRGSYNKEALRTLAALRSVAA